VKTYISSNKLIIASLLLIAITNIVILIGVFNNRIGEAESNVLLTQRELKLSHQSYEENSGLSFRINWRIFNDGQLWIDDAKIKELGFVINQGININEDFYYKYSTVKEVFVVLEYNGDSYVKQIKKEEGIFKEKKDLFELSSKNKREQEILNNAHKKLNNEKFINSRLFAIDASLDPIKLRSIYKNKAKFIIAKALIKVSYSKSNTIIKINKYITNLSIQKIHLSQQYHKLFKAIIKNKYSSEKINNKYLISLKYGSRFEPYVVSVEQLN
jgi:hypothetical protein